MAKHTETIEMILHVRKDDWEDEYKYSVFSSDMSACGYIPILAKEIEVTFDIPDGFDPVNAHIDTLKEEKQKIAAEAQVKMNNLEEQIQSLLCIEDKSGGR